MNDRILTTHAGSLPRPESLGALFGELSRGKAIDRRALDEQIAEAVDDVVDRQLAIGLDIIKNGEQARESFFTYVQHRLSGFGDTTQRRPMGDMAQYPGYREMMARRTSRPGAINLTRAPAAIGPIRYQGDAFAAAECAQLNRSLARHSGRYVDAFMTAASPGIVAAAMDNRYFTDDDDYLDAVGEALGREYQIIAEAGLILQLDAPDLAMERHCAFNDQPLEHFLAFGERVVSSLNRAIANIPRDRIRLHVCWGNYEGPHDRDVPLNDIWNVLTGIHAGGLLLSMANPRHAHEYRVLERVVIPDDCQIIAGVVDTTTNYIEHPETVADRIERTAHAIGAADRILASPDCGFETAAGFQSVSPDIAWAKLQALVEGAHIANQRLF